MFILKYQFLIIFIFCNEVASCGGDDESNDSIFNLDPSVMEKNIAAVLIKVAHSSATTKRSVPAFEAQISQSTTDSTILSTVPSFSTVASTLSAMLPKTIGPPVFHELPSYSPPSRILFTPPLPPEYANPFADKPTLRGTNIDIHANARRPPAFPSLIPLQERIPIKPPDLMNSHNFLEGSISENIRVDGSKSTESIKPNDTEKSNRTYDFVPTLHFTSISRILSGSNGKKQDIPEILLKPLSTKFPEKTNGNNKSITVILNTTINPPSTGKDFYVITSPSIFSLSSTKIKSVGNARSEFVDDDKNVNLRQEDTYGRNSNHSHNGLNEKLPIDNSPEIVPLSTNIKNESMNPNSGKQEYSWKIAWLSHIYLTATLFIFLALFSVYKIIHFNNGTNFLNQSYFLSMHLLIVGVCLLRCIYLFYDAYNLSRSLSQSFFRLLLFVPSSLITIAFSTIILYIAQCSSAPTLTNSRILSSRILMFFFTMNIVLCVSLLTSEELFGLNVNKNILPLICQCLYIFICIFLGLFFMYVYRIIRSYLHGSNLKTITDHLTTNMARSSLNSAITICIAISLLFILMGFIQLYGIIFIKESFKFHPWLWWGWEFSVRLIELAICGLLSWVSSISQYQLHEKQLTPTIHSGFALFPCGSSTSTENIDDSLYPTICSTNQAIKNFAIRTGRSVYDDNYPLNTLNESHPEIFRRDTSITVSLSRNPQNACNANYLTHHSTNCNVASETNSADGHLRQESVYIHASTSNASMLVAEGGFVRFRNIVKDEIEHIIQNGSADSTNMNASSIGNLPSDLNYIHSPQNCNQLFSTINSNLPKQHKIFDDT